MNACSGGTRWRPTFAAAAAANSICSPQCALSWQLLSAVTSGGIDRSSGRKDGQLERGIERESSAALVGRAALSFGVARLSR